MRPRPVRPLLAAAAAAAVCVSSPPAPTFAGGSAPAGTVVYALSHDGRMTVDGTTITSYDSEFEYDVDVDDDFLVIVFPGGIYVDGGIEIEVENPYDLWSSLAVEGPDRYALRRDGRLKRNDEKHFNLPWLEGTAWLDLAVQGGHTYAVRSDGLLAADDDTAANFPTDGYGFRRLIRGDQRVWTLRSDGTVFRDGEAVPAFEFRAGAGPWGGSDGDTVGATWTAIAFDPDGSRLYALRADGVLMRGRTDLPGAAPYPTEVAAALPFDVLYQPLASQVYVDVEVAPDGTWFALAGDGRVFSSENALVPLADLPGKPGAYDAPDSRGQGYSDLELRDGELWALRADGNVYVASGGAPLLELTGVGYGSLALSDTPPILGEDASKAPKVTSIAAKTVVGTPLVVPVTFADQDTPLESLVVTPRDPLPPGASWDAANLALVWDAPAATGSHEFRFDVSDGLHVTKATYTLSVKGSDTDPGTNKAPFLPAVSSAVAVAGCPYRLAVVVDDKDGDPLTVTVDPAKPPFSKGATFDPATRIFSWTPAEGDEGTYETKFKVSDGRTTSKLVVTLKVKANLAY